MSENEKLLSEALDAVFSFFDRHNIGFVSPPQDAWDEEFQKMHDQAHHAMVTLLGEEEAFRRGWSKYSAERHLPLTSSASEG